MQEETPDGDLLDLEDIGSAMKKQILIEKQNKAIADSEEDRNGGTYIHVYVIYSYLSIHNVYVYIYI
jgi:hypothetical protein